MNHEKQFKDIFGVPLNQYWSWHGFDIIKFDEEIIKAPNGTSTKDAIRQKYGEDAVTLCLKLLKAAA